MKKQTTASETQKASDYQGTPKAKLKTAHQHYLLGEYPKALRLYKELLESGTYNITMCSRFFELLTESLDYSGAKSVQNLLKKIAREGKTKTILNALKPLLNLPSGSEVHSNYFLEQLSNRKKIRAHYKNKDFASVTSMAAKHDRFELARESDLLLVAKSHYQLGEFDSSSNWINVLKNRGACSFDFYKCWLQIAERFNRFDDLERHFRTSKEQLTKVEYLRLGFAIYFYSEDFSRAQEFLENLQSIEYDLNLKESIILAKLLQRKRRDAAKLSILHSKAAAYDSLAGAQLRLLTCADPRSELLKSKKRVKEFLAKGPAKQPSLNVQVATKRPENLEAVLKNFDKQTYSNKRLVILPNNSDFTAEIERLDVMARNDVQLFFPPDGLNISEINNYGLSRAEGELFATMDDDNYYSENYLLHSVKNLLASGAQLTGKHSKFAYFEGLKQLRLLHPLVSNQYATTIQLAANISGATLLGYLNTLQKVRFPIVDRHLDVELGKRYFNLGHSIYINDEFGMITVRAADSSRHTYKISQESYSLHGLLVADRPDFELVF